ncbi:hypothetical protein CDL12_10887 [Handroanthus impetiginosus]|uniref:Uncharacterized protein n=1 Tax=Handroanthus impetiginosus TaxID=429701 RepID=A0A2G9HG14_9LAMI|nr:hypothetical protein CDL12_10887 [Handroanthus impetiginosus]
MFESETYYLTQWMVKSPFLLLLLFPDFNPMYPIEELTEDPVNISKTCPSIMGKDVIDQISLSGSSLFGRFLLIKHLIRLLLCFSNCKSIVVKSPESVCLCTIC